MNLKQQDGQIDGDTLVFGNPSSGRVKVVQAIMASFPNMENSAVMDLNQMSNSLQMMLHNAVKPGMSLQINYRSYSNLQETLNSFYGNSRKPSVNAWSLQQRDFHYVRHSYLMRQGDLRYTGAEVYLSKTVETTSKQERDAQLVEAAKKSLKQSLDASIRGFEAAGGDARNMEEEDLREALWQHFYPTTHGHKAAASFDPQRSVFQNCLSGEVGTPVKDKGYLKHEDHYHGFVAMDRMPQATAAGCILPLCNLPFSNYTLTVKIEPIDPQSVISKEEREIAKFNKALATSKQASLSNTVAMKSERINRLTSGDVKPFHMQIYAHVWEPNKEELERKLGALEASFKMLQGANGTVIELPTSCRNAWIATMPGSSYMDIAFRHYTECINLAHLLPVAGNSAHSHDDYEALFNGDNGALHGVNLFAENSPQHSIFCGKTGSGKSCFQIELLSQTQPHWDKLVIVDVGFSYSTYVKTFQGKVKTLVIEAYGDETLNYLSTECKALTPEQYRKAAKIIALMAKQFVAEQNYREDLIKRFLREFYQYWGIQWQENTNEPCGLGYEEAYALMEEDEQPTHRNFHDWLESKLETEDQVTDDLWKLVLLLERWRKDRGGYTLFDGIGTISLDADVIHLELSKISDVDSELQNVASYVIAELVRSHILGLPRNLRKVVVFEELGAFLQIPGGKAVLRDFMERMRKYNAVVLSTIQQVSLLPEDLASSVLGNSGQAFLFAQKYEAEARFLQDAFQLPESAVQRLLAFAPPSPENGAPLLHCTFNERRRRVVTAFSVASPEMLYASSSSGGSFEAREKELSGYSNIYEGISAEAHKKFG